MKRHFASLLLAGLAACSIGQAAFAANDDLEELRSTGRAIDEWHVVKVDKIHNIISYDKRDFGKNIRSFKVEYDIETDLATIARVYFDFANYGKWFYEVKEAKLLRKVSATEFYYYIVHRAPATLPDRDAILHATIEPYNNRRGYARLKLESVPDYLPPKPPLVRMVAEDMSVTWTVSGDNRIHGVAEGYIDPGGVAPNWAINYVQRQAPYLTALGFLRMVKSASYSDPHSQPAFALSD